MLIFHIFETSQALTEYIRIKKPLGADDLQLILIFKR
jgi:hypothetical protein